MTPSLKRTLIVLTVVCLAFALLAKGVQLGNQVHAQQDSTLRELDKWSGN